MEMEKPFGGSAKEDLTELHRLGAPKVAEFHEAPDVILLGDGTDAPKLPEEDDLADHVGPHMKVVELDCAEVRGPESSPAHAGIRDEVDELLEALAEQDVGEMVEQLEAVEEIVDEALREAVQEEWHDICAESAAKTEPVACDPINSPTHYNVGGIEAIDAIHAALGDEGFNAFCRGNVLKYTTRAPYKGKPAEDMAKAAWYARMASGDDPRYACEDCALKF